MRNILARVPRVQAKLVTAFVHTIFAEPAAEQTCRQPREVVTHLEASLPKAGGVLADTEGDVTAYAVFTRRHWRKIWSTNTLERIHKKTKRHTSVSGVFQTTGPCTGASAHRRDSRQTARRIADVRPPLAPNNVVTLDLDLGQPISLELEAAYHAIRRRGPHRTPPLDETLPKRQQS